MFPFNAMFAAVRDVDSPLKLVAFALAIIALLGGLYIMSR